ncbi:tRNA(Arg) A34 adenosine deaminase TadA [Neobacillus sp. B4I6]|uniref:hypothetical protein n=1 Tax=Neobacillus sp. B4I6 TaxID=3373925 RepID=UPI003D1DE74C
MITNFHEYNHQYFMEEALKEAEEAGKRGERPIGTVIVHNGTISLNQMPIFRSDYITICAAC